MPNVVDHYAESLNGSHTRNTHVADLLAANEAAKSVERCLLPVSLAGLNGRGEHLSGEMRKKTALRDDSLFESLELVELNTLSVVDPDFGNGQRRVDRKLTQRVCCDFDHNVWRWMDPIPDR